MALRLEPLHPLFAAQASGVELARPLDPGTVAEIEAAMDRYAVLVFRGQPLSEAEQIALARHFGPLDAGLRKATGAPRPQAHHHARARGRLARAAQSFLVTDSPGYPSVLTVTLPGSSTRREASSTSMETMFPAAS